jgi:5'-nucleotidase (lipoprotein e(P4) family)
VKRPAVLAALVLLAGCGRPGAGPTPAPRPVAASRNDIRWFRASAEYRGLALEVYRSATARLPALYRGMASGSWAVILDADETLLDNSRNERELADKGQSYNETEWAAWVRRKAATAIPGAVEFTRAVHAAGGRVAIVTNRADSLCNPTRDNLRQVGVEADVVLCQTGPGDKNPRFAMIQHGTAAAGVPPLTVVAWVGDNIQDFPGLTQAVRQAPDGFAAFGVRYFLLPNPMYGSWEHNVEP